MLLVANYLGQWIKLKQSLPTYRAFSRNFVRDGHTTTPGSGKSDGDLLDAYSRAVESVSLVVVSVVMGKNFPGWRGERMGAGSGTTMSPEGYILTNNHVAHRAERIGVRTADGTALTARLVGQLAIAIGTPLGFRLDRLDRGPERSREGRSGAGKVAWPIAEPATLVIVRGQRRITLPIAPAEAVASTASG